jgi:glutamate synthase (NADPH/NADH) small chain
MKETVIPLFAFLEQVRTDPKKLSPDERIRHFARIYTQYSAQEAKNQGERCLDCGNPYCQWQCPVHNYIPQWLRLVAEGKIMEAADLAHLTNTLPEVCGQVCPQEILCEGSCTLNGALGAVTIGAIENYLTETALNQGWKPDLSHVIPTNYRVAIIGAGPAGLACADKLVRQGVAATVYDKHPEIGGLLTFGIPQFKLEKSIILRRKKILEDMGIRFHLNTPINSDAQVAQLLKDYDALFLGMGADEGVIANIPGEQLPGIYPALPFLIEQVHYILGLKPNAPFNFKGKKILVLGAGDTAMDCSRTAIRLGAASVTCVYRRRKEDRTGVKKDYIHAIEEGVQFIWQQQAVAFHGKKHLQAVEFAPIEVDAERNLTLMSPTKMHKADIVLIAYGFQAKPEPWFNEKNIRTQSNGLIITNDQQPFPMQTSNPKIFAGGDMVLGANLVVNAIAHGHKAANSIVHYLNQEKIQI